MTVETLGDAEIGKPNSRTYSIMKEDGNVSAVPRDVFLEELAEALRFSSHLCPKPPSIKIV